MMARKTVERVQTGVRMEKRLVKVLKGLAEHRDMSLGDLLEGMSLHCFEGKVPFGSKTRSKIEQLKRVYDLNLTTADSHKLRDQEAGKGEPIVAFRKETPDQHHGRTRGYAEKNATGETTSPEWDLEHLDAIQQNDLASAMLRADLEGFSQRKLDVIDRVGTDERQEQIPEEETSDGIHRKRLYDPVYA